MFYFSKNLFLNPNIGLKTIFRLEKTLNWQLVILGLRLRMTRRVEIEAATYELSDTEVGVADDLVNRVDVAAVDFHQLILRQLARF